MSNQKRQKRNVRRFWSSDGNMTSAGPAERHRDSLEAATHLKLLLLAGGSFSQALSRAWSLLS